MTIETNLTRIADALEALVHKLDHIDQAVAPVKKQEPVVAVVEQPVQVSTPAPVTPAPVAPVTPPPTVAVPPAPAVEAVTTSAPLVNAGSVTNEVAMTPEELNAALVVEYNRLKSRDPIVAAMSELGATSIHDLKPEQYSVLLAKVRAL
jgi:hypothetical protein